MVEGIRRLRLHHLQAVGLFPRRRHHHLQAVGSFPRRRLRLLAGATYRRPRPVDTRP